VSDVSVIGLGRMGAALARALQSSGYKVTVWNRSSSKTEALISRGAIGASSITEAIKSSPVILLCLNSYKIAKELFETEDVRRELPNRLVVQLSTGTPEDAIESKNWFEKFNADYLDGAILASVKDVGTDDGKLLIGGDQQAWLACHDMLDTLVGNVQYTGANISAPAILDLAWLSQRLGLYLGVFQGLLICKAGGVGADVFASTVAADERIRMIATAIHANDFGNPSATVNVWGSALNLIQKQAQETGAKSEVLDFLDDKFQRAKSLGYGEEDVAALMKVFQE
jgi:3-hydroxyisobutyrate dehydrogenase-like beta-hydroxyacid dehydrogenase